MLKIQVFLKKKIKREYIPNNIIKCIIPNGVTHISCGAFAYSRLLSSIYIPDSVTYIGDSAFFKCKSLKEVIFKGKTLEKVKQMENFPFGIKIVTSIPS